MKKLNLKDFLGKPFNNLFNGQETDPKDAEKVRTFIREAAAEGKIVFRGPDSIITPR